MMFSFATGFWFASKRWGSLFGIFSILTLTARIYFGVHYPRDILVGAIVGVVVTGVISAKPLRTFIASRVLSLERHAPAVFYSLLLVIFFQAATLFFTTRSVGRTVFNLLFGDVT
jgi:undecaprenyl-diphosphatase